MLINSDLLRNVRICLWGSRPVVSVLFFPVGNYGSQTAHVAISQSSHITCTPSLTSTRPDAFSCHPHSTTLPPPSLSSIRGSCSARSEVTRVLWSFWSRTAGQNGARTWILQTLSGLSNPTGEEFKGMSADSQTWLYSYIMKGNRGGGSILS